MLEIENLCRFEKFIDHSRETFEMVIEAAEKLATKEFAPATATEILQDAFGTRA